MKNVLRLLMPGFILVFLMFAVTVDAKDYREKAAVDKVAIAKTANVKLEVKEAYKLDNAEYKSAVISNYGGPVIAYGFMGVGLLLIGLMIKKIRQLFSQFSWLHVGLSALFIAAYAVSPETSEVFAIVGAVRSKELRKQAETLFKNIKDLYGKETLTKEDDAQFDKWNTEYEELMARADKMEKFELKEIEDSNKVTEIEKTLKKGDVTPEKRRELENLAFKEFVLNGRVSPELHPYFQPAKAEKDDNSMIDKEFKRLGITRAAQQSTTDGSGGYTIPQGFQAELEKAMKEFGGMLETSRIWRTTSGNVVDWPKINDTANRAYLIGEAVNAETSATKLTDANQQFEAYKITSGLLRVSSEVAEDSAFNFISLVNDFLAERMGRGINYYTTLADGSSKPKGITIAAAHGNNTANDTVLAMDDFLGLEHEVDPAYRRNGTFMFHDTVLKEIKRISLNATVGFPLWLPDFSSGAPGKVLGHPYVINQDMATFTSGAASANDNAKIALFGNFQKFIIRLVNNLRLVRLNERFGDTDEIGLVAFWRIDSDLLEAGTHPVKYMRMSAT